MQKNVLEYLERTVETVPDKLAFSNGKEGLSFREIYDMARRIGSGLLSKQAGGPVVVFMQKHPKTVAAFYGVLYSGNYYVPVDEEMSVPRIQMILDKLGPAPLICDQKAQRLLDKLSFAGEVLPFDELAAGPADDAGLLAVRQAQVITDPMYIVFTSGSTGTPKGVVANHASVIDYIETLSAVLKVDQSTVFGNQAPLYVDACLKELYPTIKFGATTYLIPKGLFSFPVRLVEFILEHKINTVCWVVSAFTIISSLGTLETIVPSTLKTIAFGSEVFAIGQFKLWKQALPDTRFINLYGPTECTGMSCYYEVDRDFHEGEHIPIGRPFQNTQVLLLDEENRLVTDGNTQGEIVIRGAGVCAGYFKDPLRTKEAFVQNPLHDNYPETVYRTGDLGYYNDRGELTYLARKDYQIKHLGYRIELTEIEAAVSQTKDMGNCCCVFDETRSRIVLYYAGKVDEAALLADLRQRLPKYMQPGRVHRLDALPLTGNGKIDRALLKQQATKEE